MWSDGRTFSAEEVRLISELVAAAVRIELRRSAGRRKTSFFRKRLSILTRRERASKQTNKRQMRAVLSLPRPLSLNLDLSLSFLLSLSLSLSQLNPADGLHGRGHDSHDRAQFLAPGGDWRVHPVHRGERGRELFDRAGFSFFLLCFFFFSIFQSLSHLFSSLSSTSPLGLVRPLLPQPPCRRPALARPGPPQHEEVQAAAPRLALSCFARCGRRSGKGFGVAVRAPARRVFGSGEAAADEVPRGIRDEGVRRGKKKKELICFSLSLGEAERETEREERERRRGGEKNSRRFPPFT